MNERRSDNQLLLAFAEEPAGEARPLAVQEIEAFTAGCETERPVEPVMEMMEAICNPENMSRAYGQVLANKGSAGVDGMTVHQLRDHYAEKGPRAA